MHLDDDSPLNSAGLALNTKFVFLALTEKRSVCILYAVHVVFTDVELLHEQSWISLRDNPGLC